MNRSEFIENIATRAHITNGRSEELVDLFFDAVSKALAAKGRVEIRGFGAFSVKKYDSYVGRNPKTGEKIEVKVKRLPVWRTGLELKNRVDKSFKKANSGDRTFAS